MCPLRIILIFLSATFAGFFLLKNLKSQPKVADNDDSPKDSVNNPSQSTAPAKRFSKGWGPIGAGFWTCVDMASGGYLWRTLVSSSSSSSSSKRSN